MSAVHETKTKASPPDQAPSGAPAVLPIFATTSESLETIRARPVPQPPRHIGRINWRGMWTLYIKEVWRFVSIGGQTVLAPLVTSLLFLAIFTLALGREGNINGVPLAVFLAPGLTMMAMLQNSFQNTASSLVIAKVQGNIVDVLMPPLSATELTLAFVMGGVTRGIMVAIVSLIGMAFFVPIRLYDPLAILFFAFSASFMMSMIGLISGIWSTKFDHLAFITNFIIMPAAFLSGTFYSVDRLPGIWNKLAHVNPFFFSIDGFRAGFINRSDSPLWIGMLVLTAINIILWCLCVWLLRRGYKLKS